MKGIYIAALVTTAVSIVLYSALLKRLSAPSDRRLLILAFCLARCPLSVVRFVKLRSDLQIASL
jgi:hypothetical protein